MNVFRTLKRRIRTAIPPVVFLALTAYFAWNAAQGDLGLKAYRAREQDFVLAQASLTRSQTDLLAWERRVAALRASHLDGDTLDERVRALLNYADPTDVVVPYGADRKLF